METKKAPQIPYGISDFVRMRTENYYYVDKTMYLPLIEDTASYIFMIRPRRFGKSLFLSIMKAYYDILQKDRFESYSADYGLVRIPPTSATVSRSFILISQRQGFHWKDWKNVLRLIAMLSSTCS